MQMAKTDERGKPEIKKTEGEKKSEPAWNTNVIKLAAASVDSKVALKFEMSTEEFASSELRSLKKFST